ncbi:MAG: hypothetical protein AAFQ74_19185 [Cyanobacteria bacterium J06623_4]
MYISEQVIALRSLQITVLERENGGAQPNSLEALQGSAPSELGANDSDQLDTIE